MTSSTPVPRKLLLTSLLALSITGVAMSGPITIALDAANQGGGNKGSSYRPTGADFLLSADWGLTGSYITDGNTYTKNLTPTPGLVYVDTFGTGVWAEDYKVDKKSGTKTLDGGSDGISGGGPHGKEELIFTFDTPVPAKSILLGLIDIYDSKSKSGPAFSAAPEFIISSDGSTYVVKGGAAILGAFTPAATDSDPKAKDVDDGVVDFSSSSLGFGADDLIKVLKVRNLDGHYEVNQLTYELSSSTPPTTAALPEPGSLILLGLGGGVALAIRLRRQRRMPPQPPEDAPALAQ